MADLDTLASIPVLGVFSRPELKAAATRFNEVSYSDAAVVVRAGEPGDTFVMVLEGELQVWDTGAPPTRTATLKRGDHFGEMALLSGGIRTETVTVAGTAKLLSVPQPYFDELFVKNPKAMDHLARTLSRRLASVTKARADG